MSILRANQKGFGLLEMVIASSLTIIIFSSLSFVVIDLKKGARKSEHRANAMSLVSSIENLVQNSDVLQKTVLAPSFNNQSLRNCVEVAGTCQSSISSPLSILAPDAIRTLVGTQNSPVRISSEGAVCADQSQASFNCPFIIYSSFKAHCPAGASSCSAAHFFDIDIVLDADQLLVQSGSFNFKPIERKIVVPRAKFITLNTSCPANHYMESIQLDGTPVCQPFNRALANVSCPSGEALRGFDQNANEICATIAQASPPPPASQGGAWDRLSGKRGGRSNPFSPLPRCSRLTPTGYYCSSIGEVCASPSVRAGRGATAWWWRYKCNAR